jgi:hypothetical protein
MLALDACRSPWTGAGVEIASAAVGPWPQRACFLPCAIQYEPILGREGHCFGLTQNANESVDLGWLAVFDPKELIQ